MNTDDKIKELQGLLADCYRISGADPDNANDAVLAVDAVRAVTDLRRDYDEACEEAHNLRTEDSKLRAALSDARVDLCCLVGKHDSRVTTIDAVLEPAR